MSLFAKKQDITAYLKTLSKKKLRRLSLKMALRLVETEEIGLRTDVLLEDDDFMVAEQCLYCRNSGEDLLK